MLVAAVLGIFVFIEELNSSRMIHVMRRVAAVAAYRPHVTRQVLYQRDTSQLRKKEII